MEFVKYQHIEKLDTAETEGILDGMCYVFPKIDGTNGSIWMDNGKVCTGSRNRTLSIEDDNAGFHKWALEQENIKRLFLHNQDIRLYGEWLKPHSLKTYQDNAWDKFYVFDVMDGEKYIDYETYKLTLDSYEVEYIPPMFKINVPTPERINESLEKNTYLIKDGEGAGEGVVIKRYDYVNKFGRVTWAKAVRNEFKVKHQKEMGANEVKEKENIEGNIAKKYVTSTLVEKVYSKIILNDGWTSKKIPQLLNTVYYDVVKEECWNFVKENKNPKIDFGQLQRFVYMAVKEIKPELF